MSFHSWLQNLRSARAPGRGQRHHRRPGSLRAATHRLNLEVLEDRTLLSFSAPVELRRRHQNPRRWSPPTSTATARLDLAVGEPSSGTTVSVLLGNGDGTFQAALNYRHGSSPALACCRRLQRATASSTS